MKYSSTALSLILVLASGLVSGEPRTIAETCKGLTDEECSSKLSDFLESQPSKDVQPDFVVPDSPAFDVLGVKPDKIVNPSSARSLGFSLLNGLDANGNLQTGLAIDAAPYQFSGVTLPEYRDNNWKRFLARSQVSLGTTKGGSDDDESVRAAVGFRFTLFDIGDSRLDSGIDQKFEDLSLGLVQAVRDERNQISLAILELERQKISAEADLESDIDDVRNGAQERIDLIEIQLEQRRADFSKLEKKHAATMESKWSEVLSDYDKGTWNSSSAALGIAPVFFSDSGNYSDLDSEGYAVYGTFAYGFDRFVRFDTSEEDNRSWLEKNAQVLLHARYTDGEMEALEDEGGFREQDTTVFGAQIRIQGPTIWSGSGGDLVFSLESSYIDKDFSEGGSDTLTRYVGGFEWKPQKDSGLTIKGVVGSETGSDDDEDGFLVATVNWAVD